jgi:hypothetical protein
LSTFETVGTETPADSAMYAMVTGPGASPRSASAGIADSFAAATVSTFR